MELTAIKSERAFMFYENNSPKWKVELLSSFWGQKIALADLEKKEISAIISKKLKLIFNGEATITFNNRELNNNLRIPFKFFTSKIDFDYAGSYYEFVEHSGLINSIFKNDKQIGMYKKTNAFLFNNDSLTLKLNNDTDVALIISILTISDISFYSDESDGTVNLGNLIVSKRPYNKTWKPT